MPCPAREARDATRARDDRNTPAALEASAACRALVAGHGDVARRRVHLDLRALERFGHSTADKDVQPRPARRDLRPKVAALDDRLHSRVKLAVMFDDSIEVDTCYA